MADHDFKYQLERLFHTPPSFADSEAFALRIEARLAKGWQVRNLVLFASGLIGGIIAARQTMGLNLFGRLEAFSGLETRQALATLQRLSPSHLGLPSWPFGGEAIWMSGALMVLAIGFALIRLLEEV